MFVTCFSVSVTSDLVLEVESTNSGAAVFVAKCALADEDEEDEDALRDSIPAHHHEDEDLDANNDGLTESGKL